MAKVSLSTLELLRNPITERIWVIRELTANISDQLGSLELGQLDDHNCMNLLALITDDPINCLSIRLVVACHRSQVFRTGVTENRLKKEVKEVKIKPFVNISKVFF